MRHTVIALALLVGCATQPQTQQPPDDSPTSCRRLLAATCIHADRCGTGGDPQECYASVQHVCDVVTGVTKDEERACMSAIARASCDETVPRECIAIGEVPQSAVAPESPQPRGLDL